MGMTYVPIILCGVGGVGQALLRQLMANHDHLITRTGCRFEVVAVMDSRSWLWDRTGLSNEQLTHVLAAKKARKALSDEERPPLIEVIEAVEAGWIANAVFVDVTAMSGMEPVIDYALERKYGVVLANKKPLTGPWETAKRYYNHPLLRHESTVGGGQPVVATMRYLVDTSDPVYKVEGLLSGTLGFICQQMDEGVAFSRALAAAKARGYTEPDPREDLSGRDVQRKVMILARMAGWPLEETDIEVEALYSSALSHLSVREFMASAIALDPSMKDRVETAKAEGHVLRYLAEVSPEGGSVGLKAVPATSPLANMKYLSFHTGRYNEDPLLIAGKGAGVEMTAAGVMGDIIDLARESLS